MADGAFENFSQGAQTQIDLVSKAANLEQRRTEMEQKKQEIAANKVNMITQAAQDIVATQKGPMRKLKITRFEGLAKSLGIPYDPGFNEVLNDDSVHVHLAENLSAMMNLDPQHGPEALNNIISLTSDSGAAATKLAEVAGKIKQQRDEAILKSQNAATGPTPQELLKLKDQVLSQLNTNKSNTNAVETLNAINKINSLGSDPETRQNPFAQDTAQTMLAKMSDPATGVREGEFNRLTGLGVDYFTQAKQALLKASEGAGKLTDDQWSKILTVANAMGMKSQEILDTVEKSNTKEWQAAGLDPKSIMGNFPRYQPFDFEKQFGFKPKGLMSPEERQSRDIAENERMVKEKRINALRAELMSKYGEERFNQILNEKKKLMQTQTAKGGKNAKIEPAE